jgi:hypothetical protein
MQQLKVLVAQAVLKQYYEMRDLLGFKFMVILHLYGIPFHAVVAFRPEHDFLFKSASSYCAMSLLIIE